MIQQLFEPTGGCYRAELTLWGKGEPRRLEEGGECKMDEMPANDSNCTMCLDYAEGVREKPCYLHSPERAQERHYNTSKAAKSKTNAEIRKLKAEVKQIIGEVKKGARDRNDAIACFQGYRVLRDLIELERRIKETDELAKDINHLRETLNLEHR